MAFLGAYFFGLYLLLRSYFRGDLRPKLYNQITARLITVVVLAYLINTLFYEVGGRNRFVWALSFLAGVVPTTVLQQIGHFVTSIGAGLKEHHTWMKRAFSNAFSTPRALTQIDGIDIHDSTRLETEGITDVPSLAKADLVSVMIKTRLPVERLVDWMDQAILILLLDDDAQENLDTRVTRLRQIGIRTASGILASADGKLGETARAAVGRIVSTPIPDRDGGDDRPDGATGGSGDEATTPADPAPHSDPNTNTNRDPSPDPSPDADACTLEALAAQIRLEPSMPSILAWRSSELTARDAWQPTITIYNRVDVVRRFHTHTPPAPTNGNGVAAHVAAAR
jgi:hypothetical protein